jgi:thioredoxin 1
MTHLTKANFSSEVEAYNGLVVIDLWADWCGPCRMLAPTLDELEREYPDVKFCKINVDNEPELASLFRVSSIPMLAAVKGGVLQDVSVGLVPEAAVRKLIEDNLL